MPIDDYVLTRHTRATKLPLTLHAHTDKKRKSYVHTDYTYNMTEGTQAFKSAFTLNNHHQKNNSSAQGLFQVLTHQKRAGGH